MTDTPNTPETAGVVDDAAERKSKEAYYTAGQYALIWARFKKNRSAIGYFEITRCRALFRGALYYDPHDCFSTFLTRFYSLSRNAGS